MEDLKQKVLNYLIVQHGTISYPKSDGRVEIPQLLIKQLGWDKNNIAYIKFFNNELLIYSKHIEDNSKNIWIIHITNGRIRIPASILKNTKLNNKTLCLTISGKNIVVRSKIKFEKVQLFIDSLSNKQVELLCSVFIPEFEIEKNNIDESEIINIVSKQTVKNKDQKFINSIQNVETTSTELIMLDMVQPTVFKVVGDPFTFPAIWLKKNKEIVRPSRSISDNYIQQLYIIPGIHVQKTDQRVGFLLVQEETFLNIKNKIVKNKKDFPEIILWYDPFVSGNFKVYINPPTDFGIDKIKIAQDLCSNPIKFIKQSFRIEEFDDETPEKFPVLVVQNIRLIKKENNN
jgi:hypothetical protein